MKSSFLWLPFALSLAALEAQQPAPNDPFATLAALPAKPAIERGVRVVVRDGKGEPVPAAAVVVIASGDPRYSDAWTTAAKACPGDAIGQAAHACTLVGGERFALDERGTTALPRTSGYVLAWHDGTFAAKSFQVTAGQPTARVELALAPPRTARTEVVDANGHPAAGVPVALVSGRSTSLRHTTESTGSATLRTFPDRVTDTTTIRLVVATTTRLEVPVPAHGGTARLQLPECGSVHATFQGPVLPGSTLNWSLRKNDRSVTPTATGERDATFAFVQVGYEGELQVGADGATIKVPVRGVAVGKTVELEAARKDGDRYLVLRPLTPDGKPVRKGYVDTCWTYDRGSSSSGAWTNAEGWLELTVPEESQSAKLRVGLHAGTWATALVGTIEIALEAGDKGRIDKGEVKSTKPEVMLTGQIVDTAGKPLRDIQITAANEHTGFATSDDAGRFELTLPGNKPAELTVRLNSQGWFFVDPIGKDRTFATSEPARIVLQPAGRVRFAAPGLERGIAHDFAARLEPADGNGSRVDVPFQLDHEFQLLPAGHWHFVVTRNDQEVHRLDNLRVDAGIEVHDPRFMAFDWKAFASLLVVHVEDANGIPCDECTVWLRRGGGGRGRGPSNGVVRWLVADDGTTLEVDPRDDKLPDLHLGPATGEHWVRLGAGPRLAVRVDPKPTLPANARLEARIGGRTEPLALDTDGKGVVWLDKTGDRAVQLVLRIGDATHDLADARRSVDVATGGSALTFPGGAALQAAIDKLAPK